MDEDELERRAHLILGYFNQEAIGKIVDVVLKSDVSKRKFAAAVYRLIPESFDNEVKQAIRYWIAERIKLVSRQYLQNVGMDDRVRPMVEKHIDGVVEELVKGELRNMARDAIRAQLRKGV